MYAPTPHHRVRLLGGAAIQADGAPVSGPANQRHRLALLAILVANGGRAVTRDKLTGYLWPEREAEPGRNLLKVSVHELRKELGDSAIRSTGDQLSIDPAFVESDLGAFQDAIARGDYQAAVSVYSGPFLDGFFLKDTSEFEHWVDAERSRLATVYANALDRLADAAERSGDHATAVRWLREAGAHDPLAAAPALRLMRALAAMGDRSAAIRHAEQHAARRSKELDAGPDASVAGYAEKIAAEPQQPTMAPSPPPPPPPPRQRDPASLVPAATQAPVRRRGRIYGAVAAVIALVAVGIAALSRVPATSTVLDETVAILPFRVVGADSSLTYLREGTLDLLAARMTGEGGPRAVEPRLALERWRERNPSGADASPDASFALAGSLAASQLLLGEAVTARGGVEVSATLYRVTTRSVLARARVQMAAGEQPGPAMDRLSAEILARAAAEPEDRIADLVTRPLSAVRSYLAGQALYRAGRYADAQRLYGLALDADSTFPDAALGLALANSWTVTDESYGRGRDITLKYQSHLSPRDRMFVQAYFGPDPNVSRPKAAPLYIKAWEDVVEHYPDWAEAWYHAADRYYHFGGLAGWADPLSRSLSGFRRALELDSTMAAPLHHLVEIYAARGPVPELRRTAARYFATSTQESPDASAIGWEVATATNDRARLERLRGNLPRMSVQDLNRIVWVTESNGWPQDDAVRALDALDHMAGATSTHRESSYALRYALALNAGQPSNARRMTAAIEALTPDQPAGAIWDAFDALFGDGDTALANASIKRIQAMAFDPPGPDRFRNSRRHLSLCLLAFWKTTQQDFTGARASLERLKREMAAEPGQLLGQLGEPRDCALMTEAALAVQQDRPEARRTLAQLDTLLLSNRVPPRLILEVGTIVSMRLHQQLGQPELALAASRRREHLTGHPFFLSTQLLGEARLAAAAGDRTAAISAYQHYLALRPAPETGAAAENTAAAKAELARLTGG